MSTQITTAFVQQFQNAISTLVSQEDSRLSSFVSQESVNGDKAYFEQIGTVEMIQRTTRHGDSPQVEMPHARRQLTINDYEVGDMVDDEDLVRTLVDPTNAYTQRFAQAALRRMDQEIIDGVFAQAKTGVAGATNEDWDATGGSGQTIARDFASAAANAMTLKKLVEAKRLLDVGECPTEDRHIALGAKQLSDLLNDNTITSADFNSVKALVHGDIDSFLGFQFHQSNMLTRRINPPDGDTDRRIIVWQREGIKLGIAKPPTPNIDPARSDKSFNAYVHLKMSIGCTRMEKSRVVEIRCAE